MFNDRILKQSLLVLFVLALLAPGLVQAQEESGLILNTDAASEGYTLFSPLSSATTYLIDNAGRLINIWESEHTPGNAVYLLDDGSLLRTANIRSSVFDAGGAGGRVEQYTWEGELVWAFDYYGDTYHLHHDIEALPNGNILMIAWEYKTAAEAIAAGRDPTLIPEGQALWADYIIEVNPATNAIVWEWHVWDHLVQDYDPALPNYGDVAAHPERIDLNFAGNRVIEDWNHINAIDYNPALDQIMLSVHTFNEIWVIDHGTDGDLRYRWGNPQTYGAGSAADQQLFAQHDAQWLDSGNILIFNNGDRRSRAYSSVDEIDPGEYALLPNGAYGPAAPVWTYAAPDSFYAMNISGAQRLPNGNTLICDGPAGRFFEVTPAGEIVWDYINPIAVQSPDRLRREVFRAERYAPDFAGFAGKDLTPGDTLAPQTIQGQGPPGGGTNPPQGPPGQQEGPPGGGEGRQQRPPHNG